MKKNVYLLIFSCLILASSCKTAPETTSCIDPAKINPEGACTMQYDPVCGCDNKTYSNNCVAANAGVTSFTKGECPPNKSNVNQGL